MSELNDKPEPEPKPAPAEPEPELMPESGGEVVFLDKEPWNPYADVSPQKTQKDAEGENGDSNV